jgi:hypothetical protein
VKVQYQTSLTDVAALTFPGSKRLSGCTSTSKTTHRTAWEAAKPRAAQTVLRASSRRICGAVHSAASQPSHASLPTETGREQVQFGATLVAGERRPVLLVGEPNDEDTDGAIFGYDCNPPNGLPPSNALGAGLAAILITEGIEITPDGGGGGGSTTGGAYRANMLAPSWASAASIRAAVRTRSSAVSAETDRAADARGCADASNIARRRAACASP